MSFVDIHQVEERCDNDEYVFDLDTRQACRQPRSDGSARLFPTPPLPQTQVAAGVQDVGSEVQRLARVALPPKAEPGAEGEAAPEQPLNDQCEWSVDSQKYGTVARFVNHSCEPNMFIQSVLWDHHNADVPWVCMFASQNIPAYTELCYDYGYRLDSVLDADGNIRKKECFCKAPTCRGRMY